MHAAPEEEEEDGCEIYSSLSRQSIYPVLHIRLYTVFFFVLFFYCCCLFFDQVKIAKNVILKKEQPSINAWGGLMGE